MAGKKQLIIIALTVIITFVICTVAAMYSPPDFGHAVTAITNNGGVSRHPVLFGFNESEYSVLITGTVKPPFSGKVKIALEGKPEMNYEIYSRYPPAVDLGYGNFHGDFEDNAIAHIAAGNKFGLVVNLRPEHMIIEKAKYSLRFYNPDSGQTVLTVPVIFSDLVNFHFSKQERRPFNKHHSSEHKSGRQKKSTQTH